LKGLRMSMSLFTNKVVLNKENLENASKLKLICVAATGTNNIDLEYAAQKQIAVNQCGGILNYECCTAYFCDAVLFDGEFALL